MTIMEDAVADQQHRPPADPLALVEIRLEGSRAQIDAAITRTANQWDGGHRELKLLRDAEKMWREAVKSLEMVRNAKDTGTLCPFPNCAHFDDPPTRGYKDHSPECPWLLAQE